MPAAAAAPGSLTVSCSTPDVPRGTSVMFGMTLTGSRVTPAAFNAAMTWVGLVAIAFAASATAVASVPEVGAGASRTRRVEEVIRDHGTCDRDDADHDQDPMPEHDAPGQLLQVHALVNDVKEGLHGT